MKKLILMAGLMMTATLAYPAENHTDLDKKEKVELTEAEMVEIAAMEARIDEIRAMDFSALDKVERKALKEELREMKQRERERHRGGFYISTGAVIIILLLIIIL